MLKISIITTSDDDDDEVRNKNYYFIWIRKHYKWDLKIKVANREGWLVCDHSIDMWLCVLQLNFMHKFNKFIESILMYHLLRILIFSKK